MKLAEVCKGVEIGGRFRLVDILGRGSYATVWLADVISKGEEMPAQVALKIFQHQDRADRALFREAMTVEPYEHESLVKIFGCERMDALAVMWMEYVAGETLLSTLGEDEAPRPLPIETILRWLRDIAEGLAYLHDQQPPCVHGDLKLDNILVDKNGGARLTDFGQSRTIEDQYVSTVGAGGFLYLAPETFGTESKQGERYIETDIYAFGVVAYRLLCGQFPYETYQQLITRRPFPRPRDVNPSIPAGLDEIVMKCLQKRPADRYSSGAGLLAALESLTEKLATEEEVEVELPAAKKLPLRTPVDELVEIAGVQLQEGKEEEVVEKLEKAIRHMSTSPKVLLIYATAAKRTGKLEVSYAVYFRLIRWMEANGWGEAEQREAYEGMADVAVRLKRYEEGVRGFEWLHERWPEEEWYRYRLGVAYGLAGRYKKSVEALSPLNDRSPSALICAKIGYANYQDGNIELATQFFNEALMLNASEPTALCSLAEIRAVQGQVEKAHLFLERLRRVEGAEEMVERLERKFPPKQVS